jgi:hypothetical protein
MMKLLLATFFITISVAALTPRRNLWEDFAPPPDGSTLWNVHFKTNTCNECLTKYTNTYYCSSAEQTFTSPTAATGTCCGQYQYSQLATMPVDCFEIPTMGYTCSNRHEVETMYKQN